MNLHFCTFFLFACVFLTINADLDDACLDIDKNPGICINLKQCAKLLNLLIRSQSYNEQLVAISIIRQATCGYVQQDPYVCCSKDGSEKDEIPLQNPPPPPQGGHGGPTWDVNTQPPSSGFVTTSSPTTTSLCTSTPTPTVTPPAASTVTSSPTSPSTTASTVSTSASTTTTAKSTQVPTSTTPASTPSVAPSSTIATKVTPEESTLYPETDKPTDEKQKLLPEDCGLVTTFKFFYGNRTDIDDFPWTTLVEYTTPSGKKFACGGALISDRYVLTAAHCVSGLEPSWNVTGVRFGEYDTNTELDCLPDGGFDVFCADDPVDVPVEEVIAHSLFKPEDITRTHDIALLRLAKKVSFTDFIKPICLPLVKPIPQRYYTSGWGKNIARNGTALKYMSYLTLDNPRSCDQKYKSENISISSHHICAGIKPTEKSCIGDEGGSLMGIEERPNNMKRVTTFGILSLTRPSASGCNEHGWPGLYTKVLDYVPWILHQLKE